jgi:hypothetical protein
VTATEDRTVPDPWTQALRVPSDQAKALKDATLVHAAQAELLRLTGGGVLAAVVELHGPVRRDGWASGCWECEGCDSGAYAEGAANWPCTTWDLTAAGHGLDSPLVVKL